VLRSCPLATLAARSGRVGAATFLTMLGWRSALGLVCALLGTAALLVWLLMRDRPADPGLKPFEPEGPDEKHATEARAALDVKHTPIAAAALSSTCRSPIRASGLTLDLAPLGGAPKSATPLRTGA
jgi:hypothetical protein